MKMALPVAVMQAHFTAPSSERRKLMSAPLSRDLRAKHQVGSQFGPHCSRYRSAGQALSVLPLHVACALGDRALAEHLEEHSEPDPVCSERPNRHMCDLQVAPQIGESPAE